MPFHLEPLRRRQFLTRSATFVAALGLGQTGWSFPATIDQNSFALLADTHISGNPDAIARNINMASHLGQIVQEVTAAKTRFGGVIINGDCALQRGEKADYATFSELLKPIRAAGLPIHLTLGNHDNREHFYDGLVAAKSVAGVRFDKHVSIIETPRVNWFLLDSLDKVAVTPGLIGNEQRSWLGRALDANADKPAIVVAHHQIDNTPGAMLDGDQLFEVMRPRKQVKAYMFGHTHRWSVSQESSGIHLINLPTTAYIFREEEPQGWVDARVGRAGMRLTLNCLNHTHRRHGQEVSLAWRKS